MSNKMHIQSEEMKISKAMSRLGDGEFVIPRFQRDFVWKPNKIIALLKSIENNFPIGVITAWRTIQHQFNGKNEVIESLILDTKPKDPLLVIDGQQRLTSISIIYFAYDLYQMTARKLSAPTLKMVKATLSNILLYKGDFIIKDKYIEKVMEEEGITKAEASRKALEFCIYEKEINEKVKVKIGDYPLFVHKIGNTDLKSIIKIFTAMNSDVKPLTHIDLMNGSMFSVSDDKFDLLDFIKESNKIWSNFGKIKEPLFAIFMKIYSDFSLKNSRDNTSYKPDELITWANKPALVNEFINNANNFVIKVKDAISVFETKLNIYSIKNIPKDVYFIIIFSLVCSMDTRDKSFTDIFRKVIAHVSKRLVIGDYASSPNTKALDDIKRVLVKLLNNEEPDFDFFDYNDNEIKEQLKTIGDKISYSKKGAAIFKLAMAAVASENPRNFFDTEMVTVKSSEATSIDVELHHIIPSKSDFAKNNHISKDRLDCLGNLAMISQVENRDIISNSDINVYMEQSRRKMNDRFSEILKSHFISELKMKEVISNYEKGIQGAVLNTSLDNFWRDREKKIVKLIKERFFNYSEWE